MKTLVIKIGSSTLVDAQSKVDTSYLESLAAQVAAVRAAGWHPIIVTSAAIACGLEALGINQRPTDMPSLQAAASVGQSALSTAYAEVFARHNLLTSVVLLTRHDTANRHAYLHARDTLRRLLELDVVPIVNENDTVSVEQIRFGDNDTLAALVACLIQADLCVIFSDIEGLYTANPHTNPEATLIPFIDFVSEETLASAGGALSKIGSGGMITKIKAARVLMVAGIPLVICHGRAPHVLQRLVAGQSVGTRFAAYEKPHEITPKKLWIALGDSVKGSIVVDAGAKTALTAKGSSLLCVGVVAVEGDFETGDVIDIKDVAGHVFARGKVGASSDEVKLARGLSQAEVQDNRLLAHMAHKSVVHRDELVVFE
ncbi:MAG: glutamate 5-kinase [Raoultibacter sp.]